MAEGEDLSTEDDAQGELYELETRDGPATGGMSSRSESMKLLSQWQDSESVCSYDAAQRIYDHVLGASL